MSDTECLFYLTKIECIHCHLLHSFDLGLRVRTEGDLKRKSDEDLEDDHDHLFQSINAKIKEKKNEAKKIENFNYGESNKFQINIHEDDEAQNQETFSDGLATYMKDKGNIFISNIKEFTQFIKSENYDTDAIENDVEDINESNIAAMNQEYAKVAREYAYYTKSM